MKTRLLLALIALGFGFALPAADLASFNGTWIIASAEYDGNEVDPGQMSDATLTVQDGMYTFERGDTRAKGRFRVDFSRTPARMTVNEEEGANAGRELVALTELTPTGWRAVYRFDGSAPPESLATSPGSGLFLARYERKPGTAAPVRTLRALLILGGCCHDYATQKDILKKGLEARANLDVDIIYSPDGSTKPPLPIFGKPDYAKGYDVVIHDECAADISDPKTVEGVLQPHRDGMPAVNLHCAMHSFRVGNPNQPATPGTPHALWFEYLGLQSSGHGPQLPIAIHYLPGAGPITAGLTNWTTQNEELYNNIKVWDTARPIARGKQGAGDKPGTTDAVVVWTHEYGPKNARVFATTLGHNNFTVGDPRYLDLITRGLLWSCGKLGDDGKPAPGYGPKNP
jgi:uncharacterized protein (TIGR03067 family)